jgi:hypothetical protein
MEGFQQCGDGQVGDDNAQIVLKYSENGHSFKVRFCARNVFLAHGGGSHEPDRLIGGETALSAEPLAKFS